LRQELIASGALVPAAHLDMAGTIAAMTNRH
jgi:hypothetical protein